MDINEIYITCHPHISPFLASEVRSLGLEVKEEGKKGVLTSGTFADTLKLNLYLRTANRVLFKIADFLANDPNSLYEHSKKIAWENIIGSNQYFSIDSSVKQSGIKDSRFANLKLKDAIVDRMRQKSGKRPDSGPHKDKCVFFLHWYNDHCRIYIDTSGETISKHGYRKFPLKAPMIESLAAAAIIASEWDLESPFINPMCGSGTLAIEAALMNRLRPPGMIRENFGFMHIKWYDPNYWSQLKNEAKSRVSNLPKTKIIASDISPKAIRAAKTNAKNAGVDQFIDFQICDFRDTEIPPGKGIVFLNPEYGERIGDIFALEDTYQLIGDFFKQKCTGKTGYIFTGNLDLAKRVGLRTSAKKVFYNGKIECRLLKYELYGGSKKGSEIQD